MTKIWCEWKRPAWDSNPSLGWIRESLPLAHRLCPLNHFSFSIPIFRCLVQHSHWWLRRSSKSKGIKVNPSFFSIHTRNKNLMNTLVGDYSSLDAPTRKLQTIGSYTIFFVIIKRWLKCYCARTTLTWIEWYKTTSPGYGFNSPSLERFSLFKL